MALFVPLEVKLGSLQIEYTPFEVCLNGRDSGNVDEVLRIPSSETRDETCASVKPAFTSLFMLGSACVCAGMVDIVIRTKEEICVRICYMGRKNWKYKSRVGLRSWILPL
jgi:hypothetical protein